MRIIGILSRRMASLILGIAEEQDVVRRDGFAQCKIGETSRHADFVALENPGVTFDCLHERTGFALLGRAAFAEAPAAQACPELIDGAGRRREIMDGKIIRVQGQVSFDLFEPRNHAGERAYMFLEPRDGCARRNGAVSAARHEEPAAGVKLDRCGCSAGVPQLP